MKSKIKNFRNYCETKKSSIVASAILFIMSFAQISFAQKTTVNVSTSKELVNAITAAVDGSVIIVNGTLGSDDRDLNTIGLDIANDRNLGYTQYKIDKPITIKGKNTSAKVFGGFQLIVPGITIENLVINVRGGGNGLTKNGINVANRDATIKNCTFNLPESLDFIGNGIVIFPIGTEETSSYTISGNTFNGFSNSVPDWASAAIIMAEGLLVPNNIGLTDLTETTGKAGITEGQELALAKANTYNECTYCYTRQDWKVGRDHIVTYVNGKIYTEGGTVYVAPGTYKLNSSLFITNAVKIIGDVNGKTIITTSDAAWDATNANTGSAALITIASNANPVTLENLTVTGAKNIGEIAFGNGIHAYKSADVTLKNIVSKNNAAAGILINGSTAKIENLSTSNNASGAGILLMRGSEIDKSVATSLTLTGDKNALKDIYQIVSSLSDSAEDKLSVTVDDVYKKYTLEPENPYRFIWSNNANINSIVTAEWKLTSKDYTAKPFVIDAGVLTFKDKDEKETTIDAKKLVYTYTGTDGYNSSIAPKNAGIYQVSVASNNADSVIAPNSTSFTIKKVQLEIGEPTVTKEKPYDNETAANVKAGKLSNVVGKEAVTVTAIANYDNVNVGENKQITVAYALSGAAAVNYIAPVNSIVKDCKITKSKIAIPTKIPVYFNGQPQTGVKVNYSLGYSLLLETSSNPIEQTAVGSYTSIFTLNDKVNTAWADDTTEDSRVDWSISEIVNAKEEPSIWINGDTANKIKPTFMKESVKAGTSLSIDVANKLTFKYIDLKTGNTATKPLKYTIKSAKLTDTFKDIGTISVVGNKVKFTPTPFYYTKGYDTDAYLTNAVAFTYDIEVDFNGQKYPSTFKGFLAVEPVNQAPTVQVKPMYFVDAEKDAETPPENAATRENTLVTKTLRDIGTFNGGNIYEMAQELEFKFAETKGLEDIKIDDSYVLTFKSSYENILKPTVVTINFTVTDTDDKEFGGSSAKKMTSKGSFKITFLPKNHTNAKPTFEIPKFDEEGDVNELVLDEDTQAITYIIQDAINLISDGEADGLGKQKVTFKIESDSFDSFKKQPTITVKGKADGKATGTLTFTLAPNVNEDITLTITAIDNGMPNAESEPQTLTLTASPKPPKVEGFDIFASDSEEFEISTGNFDKITKLEADVYLSGRNVEITEYSWTLGDGEAVKKTDEKIVFELGDKVAKAGDKVTLTVKYKDDTKTEDGTGEWTVSFFLGNPEYFPAINLKNILGNEFKPGTYQIYMTQGKIKNKVVTAVNNEIPYIKVSEFIASKAKPFLPNAEVIVTQIDKFNGTKFVKLTDDITYPYEFTTTFYDRAAVAIDSAFEDGVFFADILLNDAQGFVYELFAGEEVKGKLAMKKIQNGTIVFNDADLRSLIDYNPIKPYLFNYKFTHGFTLPKATTNNVKMQIRVKSFNPLFTPKTFEMGELIDVTFAKMPTIAAKFTMADYKKIFPFRDAIVGPVANTKNAKYNVTFSWPAIANADSYTVEYRIKDAAKWTKKNVKKLTSLIVPFTAGEYEWQITTTTKVEETLTNGKTKISAKTETHECGPFEVVTAEDFTITEPK